MKILYTMTFFKKVALFCFGLSLLVSATAQSTDLRIDFNGPQPTAVQVGAFFAIQATVALDANSSTVPLERLLLRPWSSGSKWNYPILPHSNLEWIPPNGVPDSLSNSTPHNGEVRFLVPWTEDNRFDPGNDNFL